MKKMGKRICTLAIALLILVSAVPAGLAGPTAAAAGSKLIAFTFDDGPSIYTAGLLDGLKERDAHATFFMAGINGSSGIVNQSKVLQRMIEEGHQLANHTYSHITPFDSQSSWTISSQVSQVENLLFRYMGGGYTDMVRTPGGATGGFVKSTVSAPLILWSVDTLDWKYRNATTVYNNILYNAYDGAIVLLHDLYPTSIQGALNAMDSLKGQGYEFVTVAELLRRRGVIPENGKIYSSARDTGTNLPAYSAPSISSAPGEYGIQVTMSAADSGLTLYYTTDGSFPNLGSTRYTGPFTVTKETTFTLVGIDKFGTRTPVTVEKVMGKPRAAAPQVSWKDGVLTLTSSVPGAQIYYTTDGSQPTSSSNLYTGGFVPDVTTKCVVVADGYLDSQVVTCTLTPYGQAFTDVAVGDWFYQAVSQAVELGFMGGTGNFVFAPGTSMTRAMMVTVLYNLEGRPSPDPGPTFSDVPADAWYGDAVKWASQMGITAGRGEDSFAPNAPITRQELAQMLYGYASCKGLDLTAAGDLSAYSDGYQTASWARNALAWANGSGLINGHANGSIDPDGSALRSQTASILVQFSERFLNL